MYSMRLENLDPVKAQRWLDSSLGNRNISRAAVDDYARQMENGTFPINGATFVFSKESNMLDGHHRCLAVIQANVKIQVLVVKGVEIGVFPTIDSGKSRSYGNLLTIDHIPNAFNVAATANQLWMLEKAGTPDQSSFPKSKRCTKQELLSFVLENNDKLQESVKIAGRIKRLGPQSVFSACYYLFSQKDRESADKFFDKLALGESLGKDDPVYRLREALRNYAMSPHRVSNALIMAIVIKAWNATRESRKIGQLVYKSNEEFPKII
jgi:hypothetical protein